MSKMPGQKTPESYVKKQVKKILDEHNYFWWMPAANGFGVSGISDFCAVKDGMFMAIETKTTSNPEPTALQKAYLRSIASCAHFAFVINETQVARFGSFLTTLDVSIKLTQQKQPIPPELGAMMSNLVLDFTAPWRKG